MAPRALLATVAVAAALVASGCTDSGDDPSSPTTAGGTPSTGETPVVAETEEDVDIGGRSLFLKCWGEQVPGEPTVVLIAGGGGISTDTWEPMAPEFATEGHRACAYDRAGVGLSDPPPEPRRTLKDLASDLVALLDAADFSEPVVLVAHSAGAQAAVGLVARAPERVAGVVLVDPECPRVDSVLLPLLPPKRPNETPELTEEREYFTGLRVDPSREPEHLHLADSDNAEIALLDQPGPLFGNLPVVVLQARPAALPGLPRFYLTALYDAVADGKAEFAAESRRGRLVKVRNSGHFIHQDQPEVVIDAIRDVLAG